MGRASQYWLPPPPDLKSYLHLWIVMNQKILSIWRPLYHNLKNGLLKIIRNLEFGPKNCIFKPLYRVNISDFKSNAFRAFSAGGVTSTQARLNINSVGYIKDLFRNGQNTQMVSIHRMVWEMGNYLLLNMPTKIQHE